MQKICKKYARNMLKYAYYMPLHPINMQLYEPNMQKLCKYIDCISQICKKRCTKYARNMLEYAGYMQIYAKNMQVYAKNMQEICKYINCINRICKNMQWKYAVICSFICKICRSVCIAYFAFICTPNFADNSRLSRVVQPTVSLGPSRPTWTH